MTILPSSSAWLIRSVEMLRIRALVWKLSVTMPIWAPVKLIAGTPRALDRHRHQGDADLLAGGEQHVHLAGRGPVGDLAWPGRSARRSCARGRDDHEHLVALAGAPDRPAGRGEDLVGIGDAGAAELLDQERHGRCSGGRQSDGSWLELVPAAPCKASRRMASAVAAGCRTPIDTRVNSGPSRVGREVGPSSALGHGCETLRRSWTRQL